MKIVFLFLFLSSVAAEAGNRSCSEVDLRPLLGTPLDQGFTGHCFAHTSADLIAARLGRRVSPLQLAKNYLLASYDSVERAPELQDYLSAHPQFMSTWREDRADDPASLTAAKILTEEGIFGSGGDETQTILLANVTGLCPQERLPSGSANYKRYLSQVNAFHRDRLAKGNYSEEEMRNPIGEVVEPAARIAAHSFNQWVDQRCGAGSPPEKPLWPESLVFAANPQQFRARLALHLFDAQEVRGQIFSVIDQQLSAGNPVSVGYDADDIMKPDPSEPEGVFHASVMAARRQEEDGCYYFVRNSYGQDKSDYLPRFQKRYEKGGVWIREDEIQSLFSAVWIR